MADFTPGKEFQQRFVDAQNAYGRSMRERKETDIREAKQKAKVPKARQERGGGSSITTGQRTRVMWLITNEMHRYMQKATYGQGPPAHTQLSRRIDRKRNEIAEAVYTLLTVKDTRAKQIDPRFHTVFKAMIGKWDNLKPDGKFEAPTMASAEAQAIAQFADNPAPVTKAPKIEPEAELAPLADGLKYDKNGKVRYAKGNPWGKRAGGFASAEHREI